MKKKRLRLKKPIKIILYIFIILISYKPIKTFIYNTIEEVEQKQQAKEQAQQEKINKLLKNQHYIIYDK